MGMNIVKKGSNMYQGWITHTWNPIKGKCYHDCSYCYMKRFGKQSELYLNEKEMNEDLGSGNYIFVGSSTDMFAEDVDGDWISKVLDKCRKHPGNKYLFQSKDPDTMWYYDMSNINFMAGTTIETNRHLPDIMCKSPSPENRAYNLSWFTDAPRMVTIEPIMDFDIREFKILMRAAEPQIVNIGADTCGHNLPEPSAEKIRELITLLAPHTKINLKKNLKRIYPDMWKPE